MGTTRSVVADNGTVKAVLDRRHGVFVLSCGAHHVAEIIAVHEASAGWQLLSFCLRHDACVR